MMARAHTIGLVSVTALVAGISAVLCASLCAALSPTDFPSPLRGPGVEAMKRSQHKKIDRAWRDFLAGDHAKSRKRTRRAGDLNAARLLELQLLLQEGKLDDVDELRSICGRQPDYAAAWFTLSIAAEDAGLEVEAIGAARIGGELWPEPPWGDRAQDLSHRWIDDRIATAVQLVDDGKPDEAMKLIDAARALDPGRQDAVLIEAEILVANGQVPEAETILSEISDFPDAAFLQGKLAEDRHDWQTAMERYSSLPAGYPGRGAALSRTKFQWRLTLLADYARSSMTARELTRGDLAVALVSVQPELETIPGDTVPVMSDIVDHPGQREIITVVRLGIMRADRREHRFFPEKPVDLSTVREAIERTRALLGLTAPVWCSETNVVGSGCISISRPPSGEAVVQAVLDHQPGVSR